MACRGQGVSISLAVLQFLGQVPKDSFSQVCVIRRATGFHLLAVALVPARSYWLRKGTGCRVLDRARCTYGHTSQEIV